MAWVVSLISGVLMREKNSARFTDTGEIKEVSDIV